MLVDRPWTRWAACRDMDADLFFSPHPRDTAAAIAVCDTCPARQACLDWALGKPEDHGVWGGESDRRRQTLKRSRQRRETPKVGTRSCYQANRCDHPECLDDHRAYMKKWRATA